MSKIRFSWFGVRIYEVIQKAPEQMRAVVAALQAVRGVAPITPVTIMGELGSLSRYPHPRQLMGYSGLVSSAKLKLDPRRL